MEPFKYLRVSVGTQCNVNCWYCFNEGLDFNKPYMEDVEGFRWLIGKVVNYHDVELVRFTGGEPLLNPHITELIRVVRDVGVKIMGFTTNGVLLTQYVDELNANGVNEYAVHICQIDNGDADLNEVYDFIESIRSVTDRVRFNIVVTQRSISYVREILRYAVEHGISLLLLDLLQADIPHEVFVKNYCSLDECRDILLGYGLTKTMQNRNSIVYGNDKMNVKVVNHYSDHETGCVYCTRMLAFHPILLTPDFELTVCTHFGKKAFSVMESVREKDEEKLEKVIAQTQGYLKLCEDCARKEILSDDFCD